MIVATLSMLFSTTGTFDRRSRLKTKWERDLANNVGATGASAVLLDYTRREEKGLSARLTRRIRRMMHHSVDLQPFQATVQILTIPAQTERYMQIERKCPLQKCKCQGAQYCNGTCQHAHWIEHKAEHNRLIKLLASTGETKESSRIF